MLTEILRGVLQENASPLSRIVYLLEKIRQDILDGPRGGHYYHSKKGTKVYVDMADMLMDDDLGAMTDAELISALPAGISVTRNKQGDRWIGGIPETDIEGIVLYNDPDIVGKIVTTAASGRFRKEIYSSEYKKRAAERKFHKTSAIASHMKEIKAAIDRDLDSDNLRTKAHATVAKLMDTTFARIGGGKTEGQTGSVGLTTLRKEHVQENADGSITLDFPGKSYKRWEKQITDPKLAKNVKEFADRAEEGEQIFPIQRQTLNRYLKTLSPADISAKDFRTYHANRLLNDFLTELPEPVSYRKAERQVSAAIKQTADQLGHDAATCRKEYLNPMQISRYLEAAKVREDKAKKAKAAEKTALKAAKEAAKAQALAAKAAAKIAREKARAEKAQQKAEKVK